LENNVEYINVFDLFFKYSTPILLAYPHFYEIPMHFTGTLHKNNYSGNIRINHRKVPEIDVDSNKIENVNFTATTA